jgi:hypothetical protein
MSRIQGGTTAREPREVESYEPRQKQTPVVVRDPMSLYQCNDFKLNEEFEECASVELPAATLFRAQGSESPIDMEDVRQWRINDCYLMASLAAMARTPEGRQRISEMVTENRFGGALLSYTVRFNHYEVTVDASLPLGGVEVARGADEGRKEVWPLVIEKAYAALCGSYSNLHWGDPSAILPALTGRPAEWKQAPRYGPADLENDLRMGKCAVFATVGPAEPQAKGAAAKVLPYGLRCAHAYTAVSVGFKEGDYFVRLRDPNGGYVEVPWKQWSTCFRGIAVS